MATMICESPPPTTGVVSQEFASSVWLTKDDGGAPGWLMLQDGVLFLYDHRGNLVFDTPLSELQSVRFPWYHWGGVCCLRVCGEVFRLRFIPPHGGTLSLRIQGMCLPVIQALVRNDATGEPFAIAAAWRWLLRK